MGHTVEKYQSGVGYKKFQGIEYTVEQCKDNNEQVEKLWHETNIIENRMSL